MSKQTDISSTKAMALVSLAYEIQSLHVDLIDTDETIVLMQWNLSIMELIESQWVKEDIDKYDIDWEVINGVFKKTPVCGNDMLLFKSGYVKELTKERYAYVMLNLQAFKTFLHDQVDQVDQVDSQQSVSQSTAVVPVSSANSLAEKNGELLPATEYAQSTDVMDDFMFNQIMGAVGNNMAISLTLMEKKTQGKLTKPVLTQLMTAIPDGYMRGPWASMMVMNILNKL